MSLQYKALFLDLSGVLYEGSQVISGAINTVQKARDNHLILRFVTNTASKSHQQVLLDLQSLGFDLNDDELYTAPIAAKSYIVDHQLRPNCLIHNNLEQDFADINQQDPNCVLLGDAREKLNYDNLNKVFQLCQQGAPLIGIGRNKFFKSEEGLLLDAGPFIHAIEWACDIDAIIMGKPNKAFFQQVVASTGLSAHECLMVGDDINGDVIGAINAGLQACLVKTGKFQPKDEILLPQKAQLIDSIADLLH